MTGVIVLNVYFIVTKGLIGADNDHNHPLLYPNIKWMLDDDMIKIDGVDLC